MITEQQLEVMEQGASLEVEILCAEVRRYREGIQEIINRAHDKDLRVVIMELHRLTTRDAIFSRSVT